MVHEWQDEILRALSWIERLYVVLILFFESVNDFK